MAKSWNVVSTSADADLASTPPAAPAKWNVVNTVRDPQAGDLFTGGDVPQGFYTVTGDDGQKRLQSDLGPADIAQFAGNLPGVGFAMNAGASALNLGKKAIGGLAGILSGGDADVVESVKGKPYEAPPSNDPIMAGLGAISEGVGKLVQPIDEAVENLPDGPRTIVQGLEEAAPDIASLAGARIPLKGVGPTVGETVQAVKGIPAKISAARTAATGSDQQWFKAGLRTGGGHPVARQVAGDSGKDALVHGNAKVGNTVAASEAGHDPSVPLSYESLAAARELPSSVYNRVARALPEGALDDAARSRIEAAGAPEGGRMSKGSPQAQTAIADLKAQLLDPERQFTGQQMVNELRGLRQEGFVNSASDDVSNQQLGKAQLAIARVLEDHIGRNIPKGSDVSLQQFQAARKELAKNWSVQAALRGEDVDLRAVGRVYRADPELLDGGMKMLGEFAEGPGKDVIGIPDRYNPPGTLKDIAGVANWHRPVQSTIEAIPGVGSSARRLLTGNTAKAVEQAQRMFGTPNPSRFDPIPGLRRPPGRVGERTPVQGTLGDLAQSERPLPPAGMQLADEPSAAAQAPMGDFATVLSEGLPPSLPPGLSAGPMGSPRGEGLPFRLSPEMLSARPVQGGSPQLGSVVDDFGNQLDLERSNSPGAQWEASPPTGRTRLGDRFARSEEPPVAPTRDRVERFGDQSPVVGSEGRISETRVGEASLGDLLNDLRNLVGEGVPEGSVMRTGTRTGPSKPWLVDEDKPGNDRGFDNLMDDIHGDDAPLSNNASGQTDVSQEFANWQAERKAAGVKRYRYDPSTEEMVPLHSTTARDPSSVKGRPVFDQDAEGKLIVIDRGGLSQSELNGIIARMTRLGDVFQ